MKIVMLSTAHVHIDNFAPAVRMCPNSELAGIYDTEADRGKAKADQYDTRFFLSLTDALEACDGVIVCSENTKHEELVIDALHANKHVLCEKPLSTSIKSAERLAEKAEEAGLLLATAFPMRFNTPAAEAKKALSNQTIGKIIAFHGTNQGNCPGGWFIDKELSGGGAFMDHIVHLADVMRWLTGAEIKEVYAESGSFLVPECSLEDAGHVQLKFDNGIIADIDPSWSRPDGYPTWGSLDLRITGTEGTFDLEAFAQKIVHSNSERTEYEGWGDFEYQYMIEEFVHAASSQPVNLATAWDGVASVKVVEAAYRSAETGQVVQIG